MYYNKYRIVWTEFDDLFLSFCYGYTQIAAVLLQAFFCLKWKESGRGSRRGGGDGG